MQTYRFTRTEHLAGGRDYHTGDIADESEFTNVELAHLITAGAVNAVVDPEADTDEFEFRDEEGQP